MGGHEQDSVFPPSANAATPAYLRMPWDIAHLAGGAGRYVNKIAATLLDVRRYTPIFSGRRADGHQQVLSNSAYYGERDQSYRGT